MNLVRGDQPVACKDLRLSGFFRPGGCGPDRICRQNRKDKRDQRRAAAQKPMGRVSRSRETHDGHSRKQAECHETAANCGAGIQALLELFAEATILDGMIDFRPILRARPQGLARSASSFAKMLRVAWMKRRQIQDFVMPT